MVLDALHRPLQDLRLSVTDRCNFRCTYCMPKEVFGRDHAFLPKSDILTFEELARIARLFAGLGVSKVRVTGGEPLLRRDLPKLIEMLAAIEGIDDLTLTTNASALALLDGPIRLKAPISAAQLALLIDPQTCGPLLAALPAEQAPDALAAMRDAGFAQAAVIGRVLGTPS
jgi:cyclic pyranopterin phosphate synthase